MWLDFAIKFVMCFAYQYRVTLGAAALSVAMMKVLYY